MQDVLQGSMDRSTFIKGAALASAGAIVTAHGAGVALADEADAAAAGETPVFGYQCAEDWLGAEPVISDSEIVQTVEVDIVVCGGGNAGTQCALAAAQGGLKVAVIESQSKENYTFFGDDIAVYDGDFMTGLGFGGYDLGEVTAEYVRRGAGRVNGELIRRFVYNSGEMMDNIVACVPEESDVFDFDNGQCQIQIAYGKPDSSYYPVVANGFEAWACGFQTMGTRSSNPVFGRDGSTVTRITELGLYCEAAAEELGATWYFDTEATVLVRDDEGAVTGVIAKGPDGYIKFLASKGVALTTGDFSSNPDMCWNLLDDINEMGMRGGEDRSEMGAVGRDGQGIKMGCWAGGFIESHPRPAMNTPLANPGPWGSTPFLHINARGKRFMNEAFAGFALPIFLRQPFGTIANITDANYMTSLQNAGIDHGAPNFGKAGVEIRHIYDRMSEEMEASLEAGAEGSSVLGVAVADTDIYYTVYGAQTLDELLGYLGYEGEDKEQALKTIEEYNAMCHEGRDVLYGKDPSEMLPIETPPFFASKMENNGHSNAGLVTLCGLVTDEDMNVLDANSKPIKGLYAAGNCLGHRYGPAYQTPTCGASMGMALTHGRVLGKILAGTFEDRRA